MRKVIARTARVLVTLVVLALAAEACGSVDPQQESSKLIASYVAAVNAGDRNALADIASNKGDAGARLKHFGGLGLRKAKVTKVEEGDASGTYFISWTAIDKDGATVSATETAGARHDGSGWVLWSLQTGYKYPE